MPAENPSRPPHWYGVPVRVLLITFVGTLLTFALILLLSILGTVIVALLRGVHPDMSIAYRHLALPLGLVAGGIILIASILMEVRHYQQNKALRAIERMH